jgi:predicted nucleotidyltransferase
MDIENLLKLLNAHSVEYVIIGASAFPAHGYLRATEDLDIFIRPDDINARRVMDALREFGYDISDLTAEDLLKFKVLFREYAVAADVHPFVEGSTFETVWRHRIQSVLGGTTTSFASLEDLIQMKEAANRPKDQEDLRVLRELLRRRDKEQP